MNTMIILIGFLETILIALISLVTGFFMAYELFELDLSKQLIQYDHDKMMKELQEYADENKKL